MQHKLMALTQYHHKSNMVMERKFEANQINVFGVPTTIGFVFACNLKVAGMKKNEESGHAQASTIVQKTKTKRAKTSIANNPPPRIEETKDEDEEEDVTTHLGGANPMTSHFTMINANSKEDN